MKSKLLVPSNIRCVLFDSDGTMFDTQKFHAEAEAELMKAYRVKITPEELTHRYAGRPTEEVFAEVLSCDSATAKMLAKKKWEQILPRAAEAMPLCDLDELFHKLHERKVSFGIGTASPREWIWKLIEFHCPAQFFNVFNVLGGDQIKKGKPDPEIWRTLANQVSDDTPMNNCLVVEDGIAGAEGALAAGMQCALLLPRTLPDTLQITNVRDVLEMV